MRRNEERTERVDRKREEKAREEGKLREGKRGAVSHTTLRPKYKLDETTC